MIRFDSSTIVQCCKQCAIGTTFLHLIVVSVCSAHNSRSFCRLQKKEFPNDNLQLISISVFPPIKFRTDRRKKHCNCHNFKHFIICDRRKLLKSLEQKDQFLVCVRAGTVRFGAGTPCRASHCQPILAKQLQLVYQTVQFYICQFLRTD